MTARRPRNIISRTPKLAARAAELYDDGATDARVAKTLSAEFGLEISTKTAGSFFNADYKPIADQRLTRIDAARQANLIVAGARDAGASFAEAGIDLLSKAVFDIIQSATSGAEIDEKKLAGLGRMLGKFRQLEIDRVKVDIEREKHELAKAVKDVVGDKSLTAEDLVARVDEIMGIKRK